MHRFLSREGLHDYQRKDKCSVTIFFKNNISTEGGCSCRVCCDKNKIRRTFPHWIGMGHTTTLNFKAKSSFLPETFKTDKSSPINAHSDFKIQLIFDLPSVAELRMMPLKDPGNVTWKFGICICPVLKCITWISAPTFHFPRASLLTATLRLSGTWEPWPGLMLHRGAPRGQARPANKNMVCFL